MAQYLFKLEVTTERRLDGWAARSDPLTMIVYADSEEAVLKRMDEGIKFFIDSLQKNSVPGRELLKEYLDKHHVEYSIVDDPDGSATHGTRVTLISHTLEVLAVASK